MDKKKQEISFETACSVENGRLQMKDGIELLNTQCGINRTSAGILIYVYLRMSEGVEFKRALSSEDLDYFLGRIQAEKGKEKFERALKALRGHIRYREGSGVAQHSNRRILEKYEKLVTGISAVSSSDKFFLVPFYVEKDGSKTYFMPSLIKNDGFQIGTRNDARFFQNYWEALAKLFEMPNRSFRRPSVDNSEEIVTCHPGDEDEVKHSYLQSEINRYTKIDS